MPSTQEEKLVALVRKAGVVRPRDLAPRGIPREYLVRLVRKGVLRRSGRGLYSLADAQVTENHTLAEAAKRVPEGVVCLLSALRYHGLTTQIPHEVWLAIDRKAARPKVDYPSLKIVRFSGGALSEGVKGQRVEGVVVRVYVPAKTVADCFKYRNKIGVDVAIEALRECLRGKQASVDDLWRYAKICRVSNIMRPYLEATV
jgi:predicted transcriptional regulator of viral defense system